LIEQLTGLDIEGFGNDDAIPLDGFDAREVSLRAMPRDKAVDGIG